MKVISLIGTRPQYIKEAVLQPIFKAKGLKEILIDSGQHYDYEMSDIFLKKLGMQKPKYNLGVGSASQAKMTADIMIKFEEVVKKIEPNMIVVYGDTNTTLAGAIVGAKLKIPIAHIEAGIRMIPEDMPEEINRVLTDRISTLLFAPSQSALKNLSKENLTKRTFFTGDIHYDLFLKMQKSFKYDLIRQLKLKEKNYCITTLHRDYNVDNKPALKQILVQLNNINEKIKIVFPLHPRTRKRISEYKFDHLLNKLIVTKPLSYLDLMGLVLRADKVITDSGGLQKETYFAKKHALVLMPDAGWNELIDLGWNKLVTKDNLANEYFSNFTEKQDINVYGDGNAAEKIVDTIKQYLISEK